MNKQEINRLNIKANELLELAQKMDRKIERLELDIKQLKDYEWYVESRTKQMEICKAGSKRLWNSYLIVLTQIKMIS